MTRIDSGQRYELDYFYKDLPVVLGAMMLRVNRGIASAAGIGQVHVPTNLRMIPASLSQSVCTQSSPKFLRLRRSFLDDGVSAGASGKSR